MRMLPLLLLLGLALPAYADDLAALADQINAAHKAKDYAAMEEGTLKFLALVPGQPRAYYLLAVARANRGDPAGALEALETMAEMGVHVDVDKVPELRALESAPGWRPLAERFATLLQPVGRAAPAFRLAEPDFIPEGVTRDPASGDFFVSSVHLRKIVRVHAGKETPFADRSAGLWSILGIAVDPARSLLWAVTSALPQMQDYDPALKDKSALLRFDLETGKLLASYAPQDAGAHAFGDVCVGPDGAVYAADAYGGVYVLTPGASALAALTPPGALRSAQGMAATADGKRLYISDYTGGIFAYSLEDRSLKRLAAADGIYTYYVDGLALHGRDLIATQNGAEPQRLVYFRLDDTGSKVWGAQVLLASDPRMTEPTLFTLAGDELYLVANAQWSRFDEKNQLPPKDQLQAPLILKLALPQ